SSAAGKACLRTLTRATAGRSRELSIQRYARPIEPENFAGTSESGALGRGGRMVRNRTVMPWLKYCALFGALALPALAFVPQAGAQTSDPNAPYADAYDALTRGQFVGAWQGTISGSSISQADGQMEGQAVFVRRGY